LTILIQSSQNQQYKRWRRLVSAPDKPECPWIPVEGKVQIAELARKNQPELILYCSEFFSPGSELHLEARNCVELPKKLFSELSQVKTTQGVLAFFRKPAWNWSDITPYVVYLDQLQNPGNLGALLRTAAATGIFSIVTSPGTVSCFNNKVVRSSAGYLFDVPFLEGEDLSSLSKRSYRLFVALPTGGKACFAINFEPPLSLIIGSESRGADLAQTGPQAEPLSIPMLGPTDSLNAAVSGSILMYEVMKQKLL
jgi:TrmH family RNA methyltransferase